MPSIRDRYEDSRLAVWIHDAAQIVTGKHVYYGPNRGTAEWQALGAYVWGCDLCVDEDAESGGFEQTLDQAKGIAEDHARTHSGRVRAAYYEG